MGRLLLLFIVLPAVELALLIEIGQRIGTFETLALIVVTGIVGAAMARSQGLRVLSEVQTRVARGEMPADSLVDGLMILIASALLVTPGVLTDAVGFLCLVPAFRRLVKREVVRRFEKAVREQRVQVHFHQQTDFGPRRPEPGGPGPIIDVTPPGGPDRSRATSQDDPGRKR
jgi:UPF0716 protein FxsA